jgi:hypothetical protein
MRYRYVALSGQQVGLVFVGLVALAGCGKPPLTISGLVPNFGLTVRTTDVSIRGHGFKAGAKATFGGIPSDVKSVSEDTITATAPIHDRGSVDVVVTNADGQSVTLGAGFTYQFVEPPSISSLSPRVGSTGGGSTVTVGGSAFRTGITATLDGAPLNVTLNVNGNVSTFLTFTAPPHAAGTADLIVRNADGQASSPAQYTWVTPDTFDANGNWYAYLGNGNDFPFSFTVQNNALVDVTCYEGTPMPLSSPVQVTNGEVSVSSDGTVLFSARLVAPDTAIGTVNFGPCHSQKFLGWKDTGGSAHRKR